MGGHQAPVQQGGYAVLLCHDESDSWEWEKPSFWDAPWVHGISSSSNVASPLEFGTWLKIGLDYTPLNLRSQCV
jgi:hypothetical protein